MSQPASTGGLDEGGLSPKKENDITKKASSESRYGDKSGETVGDIKVILLGDSAVGKSKLIQRFLLDEYRPQRLSTYALTLFQQKVKLPESSEAVTVDFWDTAGQERFASVHPTYFHQAHSCLLCFDVTRKVTYKNLEQWYSELQEYRPNIPVLLVANKIDLDMRAPKKTFNFAIKHNLPIYFVSASDGTNVVKAFNDAVRAAIAYKKSPEKDFVSEVLDLLQEDWVTKDCSDDDEKIELVKSAAATKRDDDRNLHSTQNLLQMSSLSTSINSLQSDLSFAASSSSSTPSSSFSQAVFSSSMISTPSGTTDVKDNLNLFDNFPSASITSFSSSMKTASRPFGVTDSLHSPYPPAGGIDRFIAAEEALHSKTLISPELKRRVQNGPAWLPPDVASTGTSDPTSLVGEPTTHSIPRIMESNR